MKEGQVCQLKVSLLRIKPLIWRRVIISLNSSLNSLHQLIQCAMGWWNYHLHAFEYAEEVFEFDGERPLRKRLSSLGLAEGCELLYTYDFGDNWEHLIKVERIMPRQKGDLFPYCLAGENACPPEDSGGVSGHEENLQILKDPTHPEYQQVQMWMGEDFDPQFFNLAEANQRIFTQFIQKS